MSFANRIVTWSDQVPAAGAAKATGGPAAEPRAIAPLPSVLPAVTRRADQSATATPPPIATVNGSPAPTVSGVPGNHGLSDPPSSQVYEPSCPTAGSPPSAASVAEGGNPAVADMPVVAGAPAL